MTPMSAKVPARKRRRLLGPNRTDNLHPEGRPAGRTMLTPPELARRLGVSPEKILHWIKAGELRAVNVALKRGGKRARYRVAEEDWQAFLRAREETPTPRSPWRKQTRQGDFIEYY
jgi:excisionase family DNA binding protein